MFIGTNIHDSTVGSIHAFGTVDRAIAERGVHRIPIPTMFGGPVNCYLIVDRPLTLVDAALNWGASLDALETGLAAHGFALTDVQLVLLTHQHIDHIGLATIVAQRARAELAAHATLVDWLERAPESHAEDDEHTAARMAAHGVPDTEIAEFQGRARAIRWLGSRPTPTITLRDGDEIQLRERTLRVVHRPGHSPTDTMFADAAHQLMFTGDHLMADAWATPHLVPGSSGGEDGLADLEPARTLRASLDETATTPANVFGLPGHGAPFPDVRAQALHVAQRQRDRAAALLERLDEPRTAAELRSGRFSKLSAARGYLGFLEVLAELSVLAEDGRVRHVAGSPIRWGPAVAQAAARTLPRM